MSGRMIAIVGPSGVGKDSLIAALAAADPALRPVRRTITRAQGADGEAFDAVSEAEFDAMAAAGAFCLHWRAHALRYGIPAGTEASVARGERRLANLSRGVLDEAARRFPGLLVLTVTASPGILSRRLRDRGRETEAEIARRLARPGPPLPDGIVRATVDNSGSIEDAARTALAAIYAGAAA